MKRSHRRVLVAIVGILAALTAAGSFWFWILLPRRMEARRQSVLNQLPPLPQMERQNKASVLLFQVADDESRQQPLSGERMGRLGMLYHAYQFVDEARRCYRIARELMPDEFRWNYYGAALEGSVFHYREAEILYTRAIELRPENADAWAERGDLRLKSHRLEEADRDFEKAMEREPFHPVARLGKARFAMLTNGWREMVDILTPLLDRHPRLSLAHKYLARAYGQLGMEEERLRHQAMSEYGAAADSPLMAELYEFSVPSILNGDPAPGPGLLQVKCAKCHTDGRIYDTVQTREWWARTMRRMQRLAGWAWLTDDEAASLAAYLADRSLASKQRERDLTLAPKR